MLKLKSIVTKLTTYELVIKLTSENACDFSASLWALQQKWIPRLVLGKECNYILNLSGDQNQTPRKRDYLIYNNKYLFYLNFSSLQCIYNQINYYIYYGCAQADHFHIEFDCHDINEYNSFDLTFSFDKYKQPMSPDEAEKFM